MLPEDPYNIRLSGRGGQGILMAGVILAEAAMKEGLNVVQTQSYGPQARLGASKTEVVLSKREIAFPEIYLPDILLCLSIESYLKYGQELAENGILVVEEMIATEEEVKEAVVLPVIKIARELGNEIAANMVALGAVAILTKAVSESNLHRAMEERIKPDFLELNKKALEKGFKLVTTLI